MSFSTPIFLLFFLPIVITGNFVIDKKFRNAFILIASLIFYSWGEPKYIVLLLGSTTITYLFGIIIANSYGYKKKLFFALAILVNLGIIIFFKYYIFFATGINDFLGRPFFEIKTISLPLGISFYTFKILSHLIDLYRGKAQCQRSWLKLALYISLFPQVTAGPIVKYSDLEDQLSAREVTSAQTAHGLQRFCFGLAKKVLIANGLGSIVDQIYALPFDQMSTPLTWTAAIFYTLQIYYDFSGYSDMAIGISNILGFKVKENFNFPYISTSIQEFWRRWHISLSTWFKEYLYIPLGGNRKGTIRTYINLFIVFLCTGLWHGSSLNFIFWGIYHGIFIIFERILKTRFPSHGNSYLFRAIKYFYTIFIVLIGWVFFRSPDLKFSQRFLGVMFFPHKSNFWNYFEIVTPQSLIIGFIAILLIGFIQESVFPFINSTILTNSKMKNITICIYTIILLFFSIMQLSSNTYSAFIYFRF